MDPVEEIKSKIDLVDFISEYVELRQSGTSWRGVCPFHQEKTPSFFVSPEKQIYHCFGCGLGGDVFAFLQEIEGIDFPEALRILAKRAGVEIKEYNRQSISPKTKLFDICHWSAEFYHKILLESSLAKPAEEYLKKRGLNKKIIKEFKIGFSPDKWDTLHQFLIKRGFKNQEIESAGLVVKSKKGGFYDRFRQRIIFPLSDAHGQIVGFTSRILPSAEKDDVPKYINTPETPIYNKSRILYGLDKAKLEAKQKDQIILVEGNMDVLACHQFGFINTVCTSGTALTQDQIKILERYTKNIVLAFDVDLAGQAATQRSIDLLLNQGLNVKVLNLSQGKDPDEFIRSDLKGWKESLKKPQAIMEYYFSLAFKDKDLKSIEDKKTISRQLLPLINKLGDPVEKNLWIRRLSDDLGVSEISLCEALEKSKKPVSFSSSKSENSSQKISGEQKAGERFLALIIHFPEIGKKFVKKIVLDMFSETRAQEISRLLKDFYSENNFDVKKIRKNISQDNLAKYFDFLCFLGEKDFQDFSPKEIEREFCCLFNLLKKKYLNKKMKKLTQELKEEEQKGNQQEVENISLKIIKITQELSACE